MLDWNTRNHTIVCKLFVPDRNYSYHVKKKFLGATSQKGKYRYTMNAKSYTMNQKS